MKLGKIVISSLFLLAAGQAFATPVGPFEQTGTSGLFRTATGGCQKAVDEAAAKAGIACAPKAAKRVGDQCNLETTDCILFTTCKATCKFECVEPEVLKKAIEEEDKKDQEQIDLELRELGDLIRYRK